MTGFYHTILKFPEFGPDMYLTEQVQALLELDPIVSVALGRSDRVTLPSHAATHGTEGPGDHGRGPGDPSVMRASKL